MEEIAAANKKPQRRRFHNVSCQRSLNLKNASSAVDEATQAIMIEKKRLTASYLALKEAWNEALNTWDQLNAPKFAKVND